MMTLTDLFKQRGIPYTTTGQVTRGNIGIECPLCADSISPDPSMHLGINPETGAWNCWRNSEHKGGKPHYLLWKLLGMPADEVDRLLGFAAPKKLSVKSELSRDAEKQWSAMISLDSPDATAHLRYLNARGITDASINAFGLRAGVVGAWAWRVIFPARSADNGAVRTWTGRSIGKASPKYLSLGREHGAPLKSMLFNAEQVAKPGRTLVVCEGPMDAVVLQQLAPYTTVTCTFGVAVSEEQVALLSLANYSEKVILFDSTAYSSALSVAKRVNAFALNYEQLFRRQGDPGDLTAADIPLLKSVGIV